MSLWNFQHACTFICTFEPRKNSFPLFSAFNHKFNNDLVTPRQTECIQSITNPFTRSKGLNSKNTEATLIPLTCNYGDKMRVIMEIINWPIHVIMYYRCPEPTVNFESRNVNEYSLWYNQHTGFPVWMTLWMDSTTALCVQRTILVV